MVRVKHRYFLLEVVLEQRHSTEKISGQKLYNAVNDAVQTLHGDFGVGTIGKGLRVKYVNPNTQIAILRTPRESQSIVSTALPLVTKIGKVNASIRLLHVAGTIRSCNKFLLNYHRKELIKKYNLCTPAEKREFQQLAEGFNVPLILKM